MQIKVPLNTNHWQLVDRVVAEGTMGKDPAAMLRNTALAHAQDLLKGGGPFNPGGWTPIEVKKPTLGEKRLETVLQPVTGKAVPVRKGEVLRVQQVEGEQCIDFNAYNLHDYKEWLDCGATRQRGHFTGTGTVLWSGSPRCRAMYVIMDCAESCDQYYGGHRCHGIMYEREYGFRDHPNCQDTFAEAIREYGLTPDDVHDSYNLWMSASLDAQGRRLYGWNRGRPGDYIDLLACMDTLAVPVICGGDVSSVNNCEIKPMRLSVFAASADTSAVVSQLDEHLGRFHNQRTPKDYRIKEVKADRELQFDPEYRPDYRPAPQPRPLELEVTPAEIAILEGMVNMGVYGANVGKAVLVAFLRWFDAHRVKNRFVKVMFADG